MTQEDFPGPTRAGKMEGQRQSITRPNTTSGAAFGFEDAIFDSGGVIELAPGGTLASFKGRLSHGHRDRKFAQATDEAQFGTTGDR